MINKASGPKCHAVTFTASILAGFCLCYTDLSGGRGTDDASLCGQKLGARERLYAML
jgi:hypothetical protein